VKKPEVTPVSTPEAPIVTVEKPCPQSPHMNPTHQYLGYDYSGYLGKAIVIDSFLEILHLPYIDCTVVDTIFLDDVVDVLNENTIGWYTIVAKDSFDNPLYYGFVKTEKSKLIYASKNFYRSPDKEFINARLELTGKTFLRELPSEESSGLIELDKNDPLDMVGLKYSGIEDYQPVYWLLLKSGNHIGWIISSDTNFNLVMDYYWFTIRKQKGIIGR